MVCFVLSVMDAASEEGVKQATFHFSLYIEALVKPFYVGKVVDHCDQPMWFITV